MKFTVALRRKSIELSFRKRYLCLSSIEQVRLKKLKKLIIAFMIKIEEDENKEDLELMLEVLIVKYLSVKMINDEGLEKCDRLDRTIDSFCASDCKIYFEFKKVDLWRLLPLRNFPEVCTFDNGSVMSGEEVFLRG